MRQLKLRRSGLDVADGIGPDMGSNLPVPSDPEDILNPMFWAGKLALKYGAAGLKEIWDRVAATRATNNFEEFSVDDVQRYPVTSTLIAKPAAMVGEATSQAPVQPGPSWRGRTPTGQKTQAISQGARGRSRRLDRKVR